MKTKPFIITILAAIGIIGGGVAMLKGDNTKESAQEAYFEHAEPVEYIKVCVETHDNVEYVNFTEPMEIKGYVVK
jgi:hypothetical protein